MSWQVEAEQSTKHQAKRWACLASEQQRAVAMAVAALVPRPPSTVLGCTGLYSTASAVSLCQRVNYACQIKLSQRLAGAMQAQVQVAWVALTGWLT